MRFSINKSLFTITTKVLALLVMSQADAQVLSPTSNDTRLATCSTTMDGVRVTIEFFRDDSKKRAQANKSYGYWLQSMDVPNSKTKIEPFRGNLEIIDSIPDSHRLPNSNRLILFTALEPDLVFSVVDMPVSLNKTNVEIYAHSWGNRLWGRFICNN